MAANDTKVKDPSADLDYKFDWKGLTNGTVGATSDWLADGETISSFVITVATGITEGTGSKASAKSDTDTSVTVWLSGGSDGSDYTVACKIVTSASRIDERTMTIQCRDR